MCVSVFKLLEIPDPFYCSFDPHPWRHEGQGGVPRSHIQVPSVCMRLKEDKGEGNVKDKYYQETVDASNSTVSITVNIHWVKKDS